MIKFGLVVANEASSMKRILNSITADYLTVLVRGDYAYFISSNAEIYVHYVLTVTNFENDENEKTVIFRLDRAKFLDLLVEGSIEIFIGNGKVNLTFKDTKFRELYNLTTVFQEDSVATYLTKLDLVEQSIMYDKINLDEVSYLIRLAKRLGITVMSYDGVSFVRMPSFAVFEETKNSNFTASGKLLALMLALDKYVYNAQNYLVHKGDKEVVMVTKYRDSDVNEYDYVKSAKSMFKVSFKLENMIGLCKKVKLNEGSFVLDFDNSQARFVEGSNIYTTGLEVLERLAPKKKSKEPKLDLNEMPTMPGMSAMPGMDLGASEITHIPSLNIPSGVLRYVFNSTDPSAKIDLKIKRDFIEINIGKRVVVFGRNDFKDE